jgi:hypothetical protein
MERVECCTYTTALNGEWDVTTGEKDSGQGLKHNCEQIAEAARELPLRHRSAIQLLEGVLSISKSTIHCLLATKKVLRSHSSTVKPMLTEENKLNRVEFCLSERGANGLFMYMFANPC